MTQPLLSLRNVTRRFGGLTAVANLSFDLQQGEILGLLGPNGAGKTTTFNLIAGTDRPTDGRILFDGARIDSQSAHRRAGLGMARTFQHNMPFAGLTLLDNVLIGRHARFRSTILDIVAGTALARADERAARRKAHDCIDFVGLTHRVDDDVTTLSFGEGRRLELARALATEPRALLLDEPAAGLTLAETDALGRIIQTVADQGVAVLFVDHDMRFVLPLAHRLVILEFGQKIADGPPEIVSRDPAVIRAYLGAAHA